MKDTDIAMWMTARSDQLEAAMAADNWPLFSSLVVEGWLDICRLSHPDTEVSIEEVIASTATVGEINCKLMLAESLRRLHNQEVANGRAGTV